MDKYDASCKVIDSEEATLKLIEDIQRIPNNDAPFLYIDLEGISLSRHGSISIMTIFVQPQNCVYLVDMHKLQEATFTTKTPSGASLKSILESPTTVKAFFDVRNDSDALYSHYDVRLQGVEDIQLMENAWRPPGRRRFVNGLARCIKNDAPLSSEQKQNWDDVKDRGLGLFHPAKGGAYEVFNRRPIELALVEYCANDVQYLPLLRKKYLRGLDEAWKKKVDDETKNRVRLSQSKAYEPQSDDKKFGPWERPKW